MSDLVKANEINGTRSIEKPKDEVLEILEDYSDVLSPRQMEVLESLLEIDEFAETKTEVLKQIGVPRSTWFYWCKSMDFVCALNDILEMRRVNYCFLVENAIRKGVKAGEYRWVKLWLLLQGLEKPEKKESAAPYVIWNTPSYGV